MFFDNDLINRAVKNAFGKVFALPVLAVGGKTTGEQASHQNRFDPTSFTASGRERSPLENRRVRWNAVDGGSVVHNSMIPCGCDLLCCVLETARGALAGQG